VRQLAALAALACGCYQSSPLLADASDDRYAIGDSAGPDSARPDVSASDGEIARDADAGDADAAGDRPSDGGVEEWPDAVSPDVGPDDPVTELEGDRIVLDDETHAWASSSSTAGRGGGWAGGPWASAVPLLRSPPRPLRLCGGHGLRALSASGVVFVLGTPSMTLRCLVQRNSVPLAAPPRFFGRFVPP
jgi:hypothetical protein